MDWARAIERNSAALNAIVLGLYAVLGLQAGSSLAWIPRALYNSVLRVLRPAESAMRRLVVIAARGLEVTLPPRRPMPSGLALSSKASGRTAFQLFDCRKRFLPARRRSAGSAAEPRIHIFNVAPVAPLFLAVSGPAPHPAAATDGLVNAASLGRRLEALKDALEHLPHQAKRLARWRARRQRLATATFTSPLRPSRPPGHRSRPVHDVDYLLIECHGLARDAMKPDSS